MRMLFLVPCLLLVFPVPALAKTDAAKEAPKKVAVITPEMEAVSLFGRACVQTRGDLTKVTSQLANLEKGQVADKLTAEEAAKATGHNTQHAWVMQSPVSQQKLLISKDEDGSCNLFIHRGNPNGVREEFRRLAVWDAVQQKSKLGAKTKTKDADGVPLTLDYYEVLTADKSKRPMYILSSAAKPKGDTQFLLTYKTIESKIAAPK